MRVSGASQSIYFAERAQPTSKPEQGEAAEATQHPEQAQKVEGKQKSGFAKELSEEDQKRVQQLKKRDTEVRAHERAHAATGGHMAGAPSYSFETGPDGQRYAVDGEVSIRMPSSKDPATRAQEARQVRAAATAPSTPSSQDMKVAAEASKVEMEALAEMREEQKFKVCENCGSVHGLDRIQVEAAGKNSASSGSSTA